jgi:antitoxin component YwqK of YwqJK toxin-antitoxin module
MTRLLMFARRIAWFALAAVAAAALCFILFRPAMPLESREVLKDELVAIDGRWFWPGQEQPFTGVLLVRYPDATLQARSVVVDGFLHGLSEGWHTNGQLQVRETFRMGVSHGLRTKWDMNGTMQSEGKIVDGEFHGTFRRWHENGVLAEEVEMRLGREHGIAVSYYPSSHVKAVANLQDGRLLSVQHWADGEQKHP